MKYHAALKFIAIVLCAASLLGVVACAGGIGVMLSLDLYNQTAEEFYDDYVDQQGRELARTIAARYAAAQLGEMPQELIYQYYGADTGHDQAMGYYNYVLRDSEENVLASSQGESNPGDTVVRVYAVTGKYMYKVSQTLVNPPETTEVMEEPTVLETLPITVGQLDSRPQADGQGETPAEGEPADPETPVVLAEAQDGEPATPAAQGEQTQPEEAQDEETKPEEAQNEETKPEEPQDEETQPEEPQDEETQPEEPQDEETQPEEPQDEETQPEEPQDEETQPEETTSETEPVQAVDPTQPPESPEEPGSAGEPRDGAAGDSGSMLNLPPVTEPVLVNGHPLSDFNVITDTCWSEELGGETKVSYVWLDMPQFMVELRSVSGSRQLDPFMPILTALRSYRTYLVPGLILSLLAFAALLAYLCCAAGHRPRQTQVRASGLNRLPLELYAAVAAAGVGCGAMALLNLMFDNFAGPAGVKIGMALLPAYGYGSCLLVVGFLFALAAQVKTPDLFWLKNTLCGHCVRLLIWVWNGFIDLCIWAARMLMEKVFPLVGRMVKWLWQFCARILGGLWHGVSRTVHVCVERIQGWISLLPLTWQWLTVGCGMVLIMALLCATGSFLGILIALVITVALVLLGSSAFGRLLDATQRMSRGDLGVKIDEKTLYGSFRDFARNLSELGSVSAVAVQKQLKSERMKTELITNVSHDIKTPLTSIINYVDLLQKPHTPEEEEQYLEVLARQSKQLKKLIEDLIEMSKASTGNMTVEIQQLDAVEAVNQALGEFSDKLEKAQLAPIFRHSEAVVPMMADGRLTWRVLSNLLSNTVKYALPGTRVYIDLMEVDGKVMLSLKNVSREQLDVDADDLMERFVRGDDSRNTEGSGLGLNIAKSMMELQKGSMQLLVDGDLFKVTLVFPCG